MTTDDTDGTDGVTQFESYIRVIGAIRGFFPLGCGRSLRCVYLRQSAGLTLVPSFHSLPTLARPAALPWPADHLNHTDEQATGAGPPSEETAND